MSWRQFSFDLDEDIKDAVIGELSALGASGIWESDVGSGRTRILAYFPADLELQPIQDALHAICKATSKPVPAISEELLEDRDWNEEWKKTYGSFPIGRRFFIVPSWSASDCPEDRYPLFIDPGQAFGTGTHETTQLTLEALERRLRPQDVVLDLGTGSGILAIAASMLGSGRVLACDNDPVATTVARENIERNKCDVHIFCGSIETVPSTSIDLLLCNVTADVIVAIFAEVNRVMKAEGTAIFSGILNTQRSMVLDVMARFQYALIEDDARGEWVVVGGIKHGR